MQIDGNHFTPVASLAIGRAARLYPLGVGRIAGIARVVGVAPQSSRSRSPGAVLRLAVGLVAGMLQHDNVWARRQRTVAPA